MRIVRSTSAARRIDAATDFLLQLPTAQEVLVVGASRGAADDFIRDVAASRRAVFGWYRFSLTQLAARLAAVSLGRRRCTPATGLGLQAVSARVLFEADQDATLAYFGPVARTPGFPRALAQTLEALASNHVPPSAIAVLPDTGHDLSGLLARFAEQLESTSTVDRAGLLGVAAQAVRQDDAPYGRCALLLLDVPVTTLAERQLIEALAARAGDALATVPFGDIGAEQALRSLGSLEDLDRDEPTGLSRVSRYLFASFSPPTAGRLSEVELFSAPGEGRESIEIARRVLAEARRGTPFDRMAIALRSPREYAGLLEHALRRAGVPAYFDKGMRRPHPAGRAFLALLSCAADNVSARRFAEYLSLGQVPAGPVSAPADAYVTSIDEVFGALADQPELRVPEIDEADDWEGTAAAGGVPRAPWRWERLLADSNVVVGSERWERRLDGRLQEFDLQLRELARIEPDSPRLEQLERRILDLVALKRFALPIVRTLSSWPARATWGQWLDAFEQLAPRVLRRPDHVLRVLADLRPMAAIGPVAIQEVAAVLKNRLATIEAEPPARRYGHVFVTSPAQLRGRRFDVVFIPALAERMFPQKTREDPLLLDACRAALSHDLPTQANRAEFEQLNLRIAVGAAAKRLFVSFPTVEIGEGRPRVPSLYALEIWRAMTGDVPSADELQQAAARASGATLAWPAPERADDAIDVLEHDLSTLGSLAGEPEALARGKAQYILQLNDALQRSVRERYMRSRRTWSHWDGLVRVTSRTAPALAQQRLGARPYSLSALQRFSLCPYQFLLGAIYRLRPAEDLEPLQRLDPLTRGSLFHAIQTTFYRRLKALGDLSSAAIGRERALAVLDESVGDISAQYHELLAPSTERVWNDEMAAIRRDLRLWVDAIADAGDEWRPLWFEWSFGLDPSGPGGPGSTRDPDSVRDPVTIDGRFLLRGSVDLVEAQTTTGQLRVTDHKTGRYRGKDHMVVGGGAVLQPVLYGLALEEATHRPVAEGRLYYATIAGGYRDVRIKLTPDARRGGIEVLEVIDRAIENGFLAPSPAERACSWCDFRPVCGPTAEHRIGRYKSQAPLADLIELRRRP